MSNETEMLAGQEMTIGPEPQANPSLTTLMANCPKSWAGDHGFLNWVTSLYNSGLGSVPQTTPPTLTKASLTHVKANTSPPVTLTGTAFDPTTVKMQIVGTQITPQPTPTSTSLTAVIPASSIPTPGSVVQLSVINGSGAISNAINLYID